MTTSLTFPEDKPFPQCDAGGGNVDPRAFIEPKTALAVGLGATVLVLLTLIAIATIWLILIFLIGLLVDYFRRQKALARLKGSAIEINEAQFPEIYACSRTIAQRLGLSQPPAIYLVEGNTINAAAVRLAGKQMVVLMDDMVFAALASNEPRTLSFILAHELAHHALGHTKYFRRQMSTMMKWLARLDEFSCDAVANEIVGDRAVSVKALAMLLSGPQLFRFVNLTQLAQQSREVVANKQSKKSEGQLTHPLLLRRLNRFID